MPDAAVPLGGILAFTVLATVLAAKGSPTLAAAVSIGGVLLCLIEHLVTVVNRDRMTSYPDVQDDD